VSRPVALLRLEQNRKEAGGRDRNDRLVAVAASGRRREAGEGTELPRRVREELERFFVDAVFFESKDPKLLGWAGPDEAWWASMMRLTMARPRPTPAIRWWLSAWR
jgi:hypothetical protein